MPAIPLTTNARTGPTGPTGLPSDARLFDHVHGTWMDVDFGAQDIGSLLMNILIEMRVHTRYLQAMNPGIVSDEPETMRQDVMNDPSSLTYY